MEYSSVVSVIIPTFNRSEFIIEAVDSALKQDGCNLDIVVVDDGSTDNTEVVLKNYCDKGLISYFKQENKGPAAARNLGIKNAKGEYICFLDADDTLQENSISKRLAVCLKHPNAGLVCTDFAQITWDNNKQVTNCEEFSRKKFFKDAMDFVKSVNGSTYLFQREIYFNPLLLRRLIWTGTVMIPMYVFKDVGVFNEDLMISEDIDLWFRIAKKYEIIFLSDSTAKYVLHDGGLTRNKKLYYETTTMVLENYLKNEYSIPEKYRRNIKIKISEYYSVIGYCYYSSKKYKQSRLYFKKALLNNLRKIDNYKDYIITLFPDIIVNFVRNVRQHILGT